MILNVILTWQTVAIERFCVVKHVVLIVSQLPQITCNPSELNDSHFLSKMSIGREGKKIYS